MRLVFIWKSVICLRCDIEAWQKPFSTDEETTCTFFFKVCKKSSTWSRFMNMKISIVEFDLAINSGSLLLSSIVDMKQNTYSKGMVYWHFQWLIRHFQFFKLSYMSRITRCLYHWLITDQYDLGFQHVNLSNKLFAFK